MEIGPDKFPDSADSVTLQRNGKIGNWLVGLLLRYGGVDTFWLCALIYPFMHRIAFNAAIAALASGFFVLALLAGLPISNADTLARFLGQLAELVAVLLTYFLLVGQGVMEISDSDVRGAGAIAMVRGMSRTAMSFESRIA